METSLPFKLRSQQTVQHRRAPKPAACDMQTTLFLLLIQRSLSPSKRRPLESLKSPSKSMRLAWCASPPRSMPVTMHKVQGTHTPTSRLVMPTSSTEWSSLPTYRKACSCMRVRARGLASRGRRRTARKALAACFVEIQLSALTRPASKLLVRACVHVCVSCFVCDWSKQLLSIFLTTDTGHDASLPVPKRSRTNSGQPLAMAVALTSPSPVLTQTPPPSSATFSSSVSVTRYAGIPPPYPLQLAATWQGQSQAARPLSGNSASPFVVSVSPQSLAPPAGYAYVLGDRGGSVRAQSVPPGSAHPPSGRGAMHAPVEGVILAPKDRKVQYARPLPSAETLPVTSGHVVFGAPPAVGTAPGSAHVLVSLPPPSLQPQPQPHISMSHGRMHAQPQAFVHGQPAPSDVYPPPSAVPIWPVRGEPSYQGHNMMPLSVMPGQQQYYYSSLQPMFATASPDGNPQFAAAMQAYGAQPAFASMQDGPGMIMLGPPHGQQPRAGQATLMPVLGLGQDGSHAPSRMPPHGSVHGPSTLPPPGLPMQLQQSMAYPQAFAMPVNMGHASYIQAAGSAPQTMIVFPGVNFSMAAAAGRPPTSAPTSAPH
jgi:hypothetical protein